jgi:hypothetical protein
VVENGVEPPYSICELPGESGTEVVENGVEPPYSISASA